MKKQFEVLFDLIKEPLSPEGGIKTDNSIRFIYPPEIMERFHFILSFGSGRPSRGFGISIAESSCLTPERNAMGKPISWISRTAATISWLSSYKRL